MEIKLVGDAKKQYKDLPKTIRKKADKQFEYLLQDWKHPSLNTKKYNKKMALYQARIDKKYRFYFFIEHPNYIVISLIKHPK